MHRPYLLSSGPHDTPRWAFGLYTPHSTRWPIGMQVERGGVSAGIRNVIGFYLHRLA